MNAFKHSGKATEVLSHLGLDAVLPMTAAQYAAKLIRQRWGEAPLSALLVDLNYDFYGYPAIGNVHLGKVRTSQSLVQVLLNNYQTVGAGRFGETAFGLYTPPAVGPQVRIVEIDESINPGGGFRDYEGLYRKSTPQRYGPDTQLALQPAEFKRWVWELEFKDLYAAYVRDAWPGDETILASAAYPLRTGVKTAFVMAAWLQRQENSLSEAGLSLALRAAGLDPRQTWAQLTVEQLQVQAPIPSSVEAARLMIYRYTSSDIWSFKDKASGRVVLYVPGNSSPFHEFANLHALRTWLVDSGRDATKRHALAAHFAEDDREDGTFHAGVLTALAGMATYPRQHQLKKGHGFFNNDGYWPAGDYIDLQVPGAATDPFAQWVRVMKQAAEASIESIRDDAQVNRDNLSAVVEPVAQWIEKFGPLALFVPGAEGLLALAGLIDAGYGLAQAVDGQTPDERSAGVTRTVFGLLNALPVAMGGVALKTEEHVVAATVREPEVIEAPAPAIVSEGAAVNERLRLLRGLGPETASFSDEVLGQIAHVCDIDNDLLSLMQAGRRPPTPILADTLARFRIDQEVRQESNAAELFTQRYAVLQHSEHAWVKLFQQHYPGLPKNAIEQMLDRAGVDIEVVHTPADAKRVLSELSAKAQQYALNVRLTRAYEGLYLRSVEHADSDVLALHSLRRLPGWSPLTRIEILDGASANPRVLDSIGPRSGGHYRQLIKQGSRYQANPPVTGKTLDFPSALLEALTPEQRSALGLRPENAVQDLTIKLREAALLRTELEVGLRRMDVGMPFDNMGLRGGGYPATAQGEALSRNLVKWQLREIYPQMSAQEVDAWIDDAGLSVQARLASLTDQLQQLRIDLADWIERVEIDAEDMDIDLLEAGEEDAEGLSLEEIEEENDGRINDAIEYERRTRIELSNELQALWQRRGNTGSRVYFEGQFVGFRLDLDFEQLHCLPAMNVKLPDVVALSAANFALSQPASLSGFLECLPNLRTLDLGGTDLRVVIPGGGAHANLPDAISQLTQLTYLNLQETGLVLTEQTAGKLGELTRLETLDLSDNPLGVPPVVLQMPALRRLYLRATGIRTCPVGVLDHPYLQRLELRDNLITRIPPTVRKQSVNAENLLLAGNPLSDEDTLRWVVTHRQQTGINVWMGLPSGDVLQPDAWLVGLAPEQVALQVQRWQGLVAEAGSERLFETLAVLRRTADFMVDYAPLQQRVWHLIDTLEASPSLCQHLFREVQWPAINSNNPFAGLAGLEESITTYRASGQ
ncbi:dermonecrotic toxin domain-containing protein [Pseudomonas nunensis]|uniref:RING-type E3 ubiquitin transferase n=1 Tax=Pseudomonas nunensis TaxID=2961896 RepID=A0ABY5ERD4_9PSED|nr:DUF6543 domain-containing protein [Pseudomonas nunensis]KPN90988.1 leucine Rich Repeat (LRR)-containing protein [Pseudomonas nunensis]MCL5226650.1 leucine Rich Repeat (LRR)-containing protein [Pseudomonas nunensis]UTO17255.1 leucine Rich Repeat (LRR)-containing protein [Pseudomonas nunensis]